MSYIVIFCDPQSTPVVRCPLAQNLEKDASFLQITLKTGEKRLNSIPVIGLSEICWFQKADDILDNMMVWKVRKRRVDVTLV